MGCGIALRICAVGVLILGVTAAPTASTAKTTELARELLEINATCFGDVAVYANDHLVGLDQHGGVVSVNFSANTQKVGVMCRRDRHVTRDWIQAVLSNGDSTDRSWICCSTPDYWGWSVVGCNSEESLFPPDTDTHLVSLITPGIPPTTLGIWPIQERNEHYESSIVYCTKVLPPSTDTTTQPYIPHTTSISLEDLLRRWVKDHITIFPKSDFTMPKVDLPDINPDDMYHRWDDTYHGNTYHESSDSGSVGVYSGVVGGSFIFVLVCIALRYGLRASRLNRMHQQQILTGQQQIIDIVARVSATPWQRPAQDGYSPDGAVSSQPPSYDEAKEANPDCTTNNNLVPGAPVPPYPTSDSLTQEPAPPYSAAAPPYSSASSASNESESDGKVDVPDTEKILPVH